MASEYTHNNEITRPNGERTTLSRNRYSLGVMVNSDDIEAIMEVGDTNLTVLNPGDAWRLVCADEVVKERLCGSNEATCLCRAVVSGNVRAGLEVGE